MMTLLLLLLLMMRFVVVVVAAAVLETGWVAKSVCDSSNTHTKTQALTHTDSRADGGYRKSAQQMCKERWKREERKEREKARETNHAGYVPNKGWSCRFFTTHVYSHTRIHMYADVCVRINVYSSIRIA